MWWKSKNQESDDAEIDEDEDEDADDSGEEGLRTYGIVGEARRKSEEARRNNDYNSAIEILDKAIKTLCELGGSGPWEAADLYIECSVIYHNKKESHLELAALTKAVDIRGFDWDYQKRAYFYERTGDYDKAIADYTKAIELEESPESYYWRGEVFFKKNDYDSAITDFLNSVECCFLGYIPRSFRAKLRRFFRKKKGEVCKGCLESFYMCGAAYRKKGDLNSAIKYLDKALKLKPDFEKAKKLKEDIFAEKKR
jgi:tetratricopeptide (TPR) repeat protein